jgi:outer membrane protein assembly factor BamD
MKFLKLLPLTLAFFLFFCSSSSNLEIKNSRTRFDAAKTFYLEKSYVKAMDELKIIAYEKGVEYADSIQYLLAECFYNTDQYILAGAEYGELVRFTPNSSLVPEARYKIGLCYSMISPNAYLDQNYTLKAITELQTFIEYFPTHPRARDAERLIIELRNKLAEKEYKTAILYTKMSKYRSALLYYNSVLEKFHDSSYADLAQFGIIEIYILQDKKDLAKFEINKFLNKYPNSKKKEEVIKMKESI